ADSTRLCQRAAGAGEPVVEGRTRVDCNAVKLDVPAQRVRRELAIRKLASLGAGHKRFVGSCGRDPRMWFAQDTGMAARAVTTRSGIGGNCGSDRGSSSFARS